MDALIADKRNAGIRKILAAEKDAQQIVYAARTEKLAKLKEAKEKAQEEAAAYRELMEFELQEKSRESSGAYIKRLEQKVEEKINHLQLDAERMRHDVVNMLLKHVRTVSV